MVAQPHQGWNYDLQLFDALGKPYVAQCQGVIVTINPFHDSNLNHSPFGAEYHDYFYVLQYLSGENTWAGIQAWKEERY